MHREIRTEGAPTAIGPYSQAIRVRAEELVYTAGQLGLVPDSGTLVAGGVGAECEQALRNLQAVVEAAGSGMDHVVKTTVFLLDMGEFAAMNAVYERFFTRPYPARSAVQVAALPKGARVEIEAVAAAG
ncbi:MAG: RidA family protein [Candidatus Eisenbacteria bacterium]